jgi:hypothetical protein
MNEKEIIMERVRESLLYKSAIQKELNDEDQILLQEATKELSINFELLAERLFEMSQDKEASRKFSEALINSKNSV